MVEQLFLFSVDVHFLGLQSRGGLRHQIREVALGEWRAQGLALLLRYVLLARALAAWTLKQYILICLKPQFVPILLFFLRSFVIFIIVRKSVFRIYKTNDTVLTVGIGTRVGSVDQVYA